VIGFGMLALLVAIALRARQAMGTDHVDGTEPVEQTP
jgi:multisubunit Na+/H+ antiporter MnhC subunit